MTPEQEFFTKLTALARLVPNFELTKDITAIYDQHLAPLGYPNVNRALDQIIVDRSSRDPFPSVKEIRSLINPEADPDAESVYIANQVLEAIARCGPYQTPDLGEVGNELVRMEGGWLQICEMVTNDKIPTFKAQWRQLAKSLLLRKRNNVTALPTHNEVRSLEAFTDGPGSLLKTMPGANGGGV